MDATFQKFIAEQRRQGRKIYARWNEQLFEQICQGPAKYFWTKCGQDTGAFENYLRMLVQGMGDGYVTQSADPQHHEFFVEHLKWRSLLEYWLVLQAPLEIPTFPPDRRLQLLTKLWNLGENILRAQSWIDPYLLKKVLAARPSLLQVENDLNRWMDPLLRRPPAATWEAPFRVQVLDGRIIHHDFLPGEIHQSAPSVVCVQDRRLDNLFGGVFLNEEPFTILCHHTDLGHYEEPTPALRVEFGPNAATINGHTVNLPFLSRPHSHLIVGAGVLLVSAVDSQRLWIIRSK